MGDGQRRRRTKRCGSEVKGPLAWVRGISMSRVAAILHPAVDRGAKTAPLKSAIGQDAVHTLYQILILPGENQTPAL
jgi:hypothetical protein